MYIGRDEFVGMGADAATTAPRASIAQQLIDIIPVAANIYQQRMQMKAQMQRMERGLPPIDFEQYSPPVQARVGVDNRTMYLLIGGAALFGALMLIRRNR